MTAVVTDRELRARVAAEGLACPDPRHSNVRTVIHQGALVAVLAGGWAIDHVAVWPLAWITAGVLLFGNLLAAHEAAHGNLYRSRRANTVAGMLWGLPVLLPFAVYRPNHHDHHRFTRAPGDTEPLDGPRGLRQAIVQVPVGLVAFYPRAWWHGVRTVLGRPPVFIRTARQRRLVAANMALLLLAAAGLVAAGLVAPRPLVMLWLIPWVIATVVVQSLVIIPEHYACGFGPASPLRTTRTVLTPAPWRVLLWNQNLHAGHHLVASVPSQNLPRLHALLEAHMDHVESGYLRFYRAAVADALWGPGPPPPPAEFAAVDVTGLDRGPRPDPLADPGPDLG